MLSVLIATKNSERALVATLAALVPGAAAGTIREVIVADGGSDDETREVADIAGCQLLVLPQASVAARLRAAAAAARGPWLMLWRPGVMPDPAWVGEAARFMALYERSGRHDIRGAVFRPASDPFGSLWSEAVTLLRTALSRPTPNQGLIMRKAAYEALGGHRDDAADAETDLIRRIGRGRIATLRCGVTRIVTRLLD